MLSTTPVEIRGQQYVLLDDPEGVAPQGCAVSTPLYLVLSLCDGRRSPEDIQAAVVAEVRRFVSLAEVTQALEELERHGLLEGQRAAQRLEELTRAYRSGPREATLAGTVYPAEADALRATLEGLLAKADPSLPEGILADCLVAPHIDLGRGAAVYAEAYAAARKHVRARTFLILGAAVVAFVSGRIPLAVVSVGVALALWATGVLTLGEALSGFGDPTVLFIASLFVVSEALDATGVTAWLGQQVVTRAGTGRMRLTVVIGAMVAVLSA